MKTFKWKSIMAAAIATVIVLAGTVTMAGAQATAKNNPAMRDEKVAINRDLQKINLQQKKVEALEKQCREQKAAGVKSSATRNEYLKAKADLKRDKAYLRADKTDLMMEHRALIAKRQEAVKEQRAELKESRKKLDADLAKGNATAVLRTQQVVDAKQQLKKDEAALEQAKLDRNGDLLVVNKEIRDVNGQSFFVLTIENSTAKVQNLALK